MQLLSTSKNFLVEFYITTHKPTDGRFGVLVIFLVSFHELQVENHSCKFLACHVLSQLCDS